MNNLAPFQSAPSLDLGELNKSVPRLGDTIGAFAEQVLAANPSAQSRLLSRLDAINNDSRVRVLGRDAEIRALITDAGGIFTGIEENQALGIAPRDRPAAIPPEFSIDFLSSPHLLRGGLVAGHVILGFDPRDNNWVCIDRGAGGESDIVPGSLGPNVEGLPAHDQYELIANVSIKGVTLASPNALGGIERVINTAVALHIATGKPIESLPFRGVWGRTADITRAMDGCRTLLGFTDGIGIKVHTGCESSASSSHLGLLACWVHDEFYAASSV